MPNFVEKENEVLALAMIGKNFGQRPSQLVGIDDETFALDFDLVCSYRLLLQDLERAKAEADALKGENGESDGYIQGKVTKDTMFL